MSTGTSTDDHGLRLRERRGRMAVWGLGYIGFSTAKAFAAEGVDVVGYDPSGVRVAQLRSLASPGIEVSQVPDAVVAADCCVHMVAVPTEREGEPYSDALLWVVGNLAESITNGHLTGTVPLVVVESTLTPGTTEEQILPMLSKHDLEVGRDLLIGLAPRRDWFLAEGFGLRELDRVYAGVDERSTRATHRVLGLVNDVLHRAPSYREGELVKCVENAYRHMDITLANQLTLAYPDADMVEVLRLAGTKWNITTYHPSFGTGGYCIPLASRYLLRGAQYPEQLSLLEQTIATDDRMRLLVAEAVKSKPPVMVLGIAYKGNIKVDILSPAKAIIKYLADRGTPVCVHDPFYSAAELDAIIGPGLAAEDLVAAVRKARSVLVIPDHREFATPGYVDLLNEPRDEPLVVIDNHGVLEQVRWADHVIYKRAGSQRWLTLEEAPE